jgi:hypothetical protein
MALILSLLVFPLLILLSRPADKLIGTFPDYTGPASGHFGDSIQYVNDSGNLTVISGASSSWGCSHNTGIAFEAADEPPYTSICAEDHE